MQHDAYMDGYHDGDMNDMGGGMGGMAVSYTHLTLPTTPYV